MAGPTKGERTRSRILDAAEKRFAKRGYSATSLREIAAAAGLQQPGLYNHFANKEALYAAVLDRALEPMADALEEHLSTDDADAMAALPGVITDHLCAHPHVASLFQQALDSDAKTAGDRLMRAWLDRLFDRGLRAARSASASRIDRAELAIWVLGMFHLCTGYFRSQRAFARMAKGRLTDAANLARQKKMLARFAQASLP